MSFSMWASAGIALTLSALLRALPILGALSPKFNPFVSKYQLELPKKEEIRRFLEEQIKSEKTSKEPGHGG